MDRLTEDLFKRLISEPKSEHSVEVLEANIFYQKWGGGNDFFFDFFYFKKIFFSNVTLAPEVPLNPEFFVLSRNFGRFSEKIVNNIF